ncbi:hypothetical protein EW145_g3099 [Phellinidium pouzarii]|uniref:FAD dependent oxidoreductase domain-containing protein n=1 Tax=Phellinidium pouzarii TaxID=167371 RepID=A0A4V6S182_9AGAM|nr:hypothetical protein EW145_g3099 [Phellinidium pouzarii]
MVDPRLSQASINITTRFPVPLNEFKTHQKLFDAQLNLADAPASLPVANSTRSFWLHPSDEVNPLARKGSTGPLTSDADICIIGSGITGVSAAYHLSKMSPNKKIVMLEARDFCSGATGRNGGHLTAGIFLHLRNYVEEMGLTEALKNYALERHTSSAILSIIQENGLEVAVDLVSGGHIDMFFTDEEVKEGRADFALAENSGAKVDKVKWLSKEEMSAKYGTSYAAVQIPGHNLWPLKLVTQIFYITQKMFSSSAGSLNLHTNTPVTAVSSSTTRRLWTLTTPRGTITCSTVVHATNAYASHLLPQLAGPRGIVPVRGQVLATRAAASLDTIGRSSWGGNEGFEYWFPRPPKVASDEEKPLVILGGGREAVQDYEFGISDDSEVNAQAGRALRAFLPTVFPGRYDEGSEPEMEWTGIMGYTSTRDPFVGPVLSADGSEIPGQYISAGYTGHGMPRAYACAEVVASLITSDFAGKRDRWTIPEWLPKRYLTWNRV